MQSATQPSQSLAEFFRAQRHHDECREVGRLQWRIKQLEWDLRVLKAENARLRAQAPDAE